MDWCTSSSRSEKDSSEKCGLMPTSSCICCFSSSSEKVSIPQSVWWIRMISRVPSIRWEIARDRISSSVMTPPAFRITCASPSSSPRILCTSRRASMHATSATPLAGGSGRSPLSNASAYAALFLSRSSVTLMRHSSLAYSLSGHVRFEGVGKMVDRSQLHRVLAFHVLDELLFRVEEHLGIALLLLSQGRVLAAVVVVTRVDEQFVGEGPVSVIKGMVLADSVAVREVG